MWLPQGAPVEEIASLLQGALLKVEAEMERAEVEKAKAGASHRMDIDEALKPSDADAAAGPAGKGPEGTESLSDEMLGALVNLVSSEDAASLARALTAAALRLAATRHSEVPRIVASGSIGALCRICANGRVLEKLEKRAAATRLLVEQSIRALGNLALHKIDVGPTMKAHSVE